MIVVLMRLDEVKDRFIILFQIHLLMLFIN